MKESYRNLTTALKIFSHFVHHINISIGNQTLAEEATLSAEVWECYWPLL
jgi:hypothetical protein